MAKKHKSSRPAANAQEKINKAVRLSATDNENINDDHNINKESLGPNTKR